MLPRARVQRRQKVPARRRIKQTRVIKPGSAIRNKTARINQFSGNFSRLRPGDLDIRRYLKQNAPLRKILAKVGQESQERGVNGQHAVFDYLERTLKGLNFNIRHIDKRDPIRYETNEEREFSERGGHHPSIGLAISSSDSKSIFVIGWNELGI